MRNHTSPKALNIEENDMILDMYFYQYGSVLIS